MATIVCQGTQSSCVESKSREPLTLRLKLTSPPQPSCPSPQTSSESSEVPKKTRIPETGRSDWSFSQIKEQIFSDFAPKSVLSERSLDMCTEDLGNETGCTEMFGSTRLSASQNARAIQWTRHSNKAGHTRSFPPPLSTISGVESLQVRHHREGGRLIIEAVKAPSAYSGFQAERSHGRLRLCFLKEATSCSDFDGEEDAQEEIKDGPDEEGDDIVLRERAREQENDIDDICLGKDMKGNNGNIGANVGIEIFAWPGRCKEGEVEGKKGLLDWGAFWVATS